MTVISHVPAGAGSALPLLPASAASISSIPVSLEDCVARVQQVIERFKWQVPSDNLELRCPINALPMQDPVTIIYEKRFLGLWNKLCHTFERIEIEKVLSRGGACPLCRRKIIALSPNTALQRQIRKSLKTDPIPTFLLFKKESKDPALAEAHMESAKLHVARAVKLYQERNYDVSDAERKKAETAYAIAYAYTNASEHYGPLSSLYEALEDPERATFAYLYLALYQLQEGKVAEAITTLEQAKKISPISLTSLKIDVLLVDLILGLAASPERTAKVMEMAKAREKPKEAIAIYKQVIAHSPRQYDAYEALASLLKDPVDKKNLLLQAATYAEEEGNLELVLHFRTESERPPLLTEFSKEMWTNPTTFMNRLPPYPQALKDFLAGDCTIWPGKKRSETFIVVPLFPEVDIDGTPAPRTLDSLDQLDKASGGKGYEYICGQIPKNTAAEAEFHWAVMTRDILPGSGGKTYEEQKHLVEEKGYEVPDVLTAATAIFWQSRLDRLTGSRCFSDSPWTYTCCKEAVQGRQLVVGGFAPGGFRIRNYYFVFESIGVGALRKF